MLRENRFQATGSNMKRQHRIASLLAGAALAVAAVGAPAAEDPASTPPLRVFDATEITPDRYTVIARLWVDRWQASFWLKNNTESSAALAALTAEAARLGADAVTNVTCPNDARAWFDAGYLCYGLAIKLK